MGFKTKAKIQTPFATKAQIDKAYREGRPLITDQKYDEMFGNQASDMETPLEDSGWKKHRHQVFMHSLVKTDIIESGSVFWDNLSKWCLNTEQSWFENAIKTPLCHLITWKYDGIAIGLDYENGKLVSASTRGDGFIGEDILSNVLKMKNVKPEIKDFTGTLKAEIVTLLEDYNNYMETTTDERPYKTPRNAAAGASKSHSGRNAEILTLMYYEAISDDLNFQSELEMFKWLKKNFHYVDYDIVMSLQDIKDIYAIKQRQRPTTNFDVDGLVIAVNDKRVQRSMGFNSDHRPLYKTAIKFLHKTAKTKLLDIEWSVGKQGCITPIGILEPVTIDVTISRVNMGNPAIIDSKKVMIGDEVLISRRNDVIPYLEESLTPHSSDSFQRYPEKCPVCGTRTTMDGPRLMCPNTKCDARKLGDLEKWIDEIKNEFKSKGLGEERIKELFDKKLVLTVSDLYRLNENDLIDELDGVGEKAAQNILEFQKYKEIPIEIFLAALNIKGLGKGMWKKLIEAGYWNFDSITNLVTPPYTVMPKGVTKAMLTKMYDGLQDKDQEIRELKMLGVSMVEEKYEPQNLEGPLSGKVFCVTGVLSKSREEVQQMIRDKAGIVKSGVSSKVHYLVAGDKVGRTKSDKAEKLGVKVITEQELYSLMGE